MVTLADGEGSSLSLLNRQLSPTEVNMDLTMCGLLLDRAEELARLYHHHGNWNDVKRVWFDERRSNRSTRDSSQKIFRVLTSRFKNAPPSLPNAGDLPTIFDRCTTTREKAQVLYPYLVTDDPLVRYVVHEYVARLTAGREQPLDFSDETLTELLTQLEYADGTQLDYAESTIHRWCVGFRSVMRDIGVLESKQDVVGAPPPLGDTSLLVAMGYSQEEGGERWTTAPRGLLYLFQPENRWEELFDRIVATDAWEFTELHGEYRLQPKNSTYTWVDTEVAE